jgi:hypothetical protein
LWEMQSLLFKIWSEREPKKDSDWKLSQIAPNRPKQRKNKHRRERKTPKSVEVDRSIIHLSQSLSCCWMAFHVAASLSSSLQFVRVAVMACVHCASQGGLILRHGHGSTLVASQGQRISGMTWLALRHAQSISSSLQLHVLSTGDGRISGWTNCTSRQGQISKWRHPQVSRV